MRSQSGFLERPPFAPPPGRPELEDESIGLHYRLIRLRLALRYSAQPRVEAILREVIEQIEKRLDRLGG